jgi:hypothetical protein
VPGAVLYDECRTKIFDRPWWRKTSTPHRGRNFQGTRWLSRQIRTGQFDTPYALRQSSNAILRISQRIWIALDQSFGRIQRLLRKWSPGLEVRANRGPWSISRTITRLLSVRPSVIKSAISDVRKGQRRPCSGESRVPERGSFAAPFPCRNQAAESGEGL